MDIPQLPIPGGHLDLIRGEAVVDGRSQRLSNIEVAVLSVLADAEGEPVSEEELLERAWGYRTTKTRTVSMGISRLRGKVERDPKSPRVVLTVRGVGYRLTLAREAPPETPAVARVPTGRADVVAAIQSARQDGRRTLELVGPGGVGTSTIARAATQDPVWVELRHVERPEGLLRRTLEALGEEGADGRARAERALARVDDVVFDGAEELSPEAVELLGVLTHHPAGTCIVTTRRPLGLGHPVPVRPLERPDVRRVSTR